MNPKNFPERKRLRQLGALERLSAETKAGVSNAKQIAALKERTEHFKRDIRTKKDRSARARFRAA